MTDITDHADSDPGPTRSGVARVTGRVAVWLTRLAHRLGTHYYLSTGCLHGEHSYCQGKQGQAGEKRPAVCKFCVWAPCCCRCHKKESSDA